MQYRLKNENYHTFEIFGKNKRDPRAYFIPFSEKEKALSCDVTEQRYSSDLIKCLSGEWEFCFFKDPKNLPDLFDTDAAAFDKVTVPSVWEYTGYLDPMYLCTYIPFPFDPPKIPTEKEIGLFRLAKNNWMTFYAKGQYNSVGVYRKKFFVEDAERNFVISFLGVASCLDLYLNGEFIGYSEGSHNTAEFLLNGKIQEGENELIAVVHRFSNGTYLETQDMFRNNGIFRDVLLYVTDKKHILDYYVTTKKVDKSYDLSVTVWIENSEKSDEVNFEFLGKTYTAACNENGKAELTINKQEVEEWSAETPTLYPLLISFAQKEYVCEKVGFCTKEIKKDVYYFNGKNLKIKGVDHHDTHPEKGSAMSVTDMLLDVKLMKEYNVNAVRTSHYPPDPVFVRLCRQYGLYLIEEADIETHCAHASHNLSYISRDGRWKEHYLDRVKRMYGRDRNLCNVVLWSLGNESGGLTCQKYCYDYLKTVTDTPVHYEWCGAETEVGFDVLSEMYTPLEKMKERAASRFTDSRRMKPYFLCEYAHSMGVGPGALEDYVELFLSEDVYMGGCIWEWADHSVYHKNNGNFTYGGDHHDFIIDKTFCIDGLFRPDRKPYTSAYVMKSAYRPVRAKLIKEGEVEFFNTNSFLSTEYLAISYRLSLSGIEGKESPLPFILAPGEKKVLRVDYPVGTDAFLNIIYVEKSTGKVVAEEQVILSERLPDASESKGELLLRRDDRKAEILFGSNSRIVFDCARAGISSYKVDGTELISRRPTNRHHVSGVYEEIYRAPLCNDIKIKARWQRKGLGRYKIGPVKSDVKKEGETIVVAFSYRLYNIILPIASVCDVYTVYPGGKVAIETSFTPFIKEEILPRVGKTFEFKYDFDHVKYYGRGDRENYPDMKAHAKIGLCEKEGNFGEKMIVPQNSGERMDVRWAEVTNNEGVGIRFEAVEKAFGLNVNHYDEKTLASWKHIIDYKDMDATFVNIDGFVCGVGSASCGPLPEMKYRIPEGEKLTYSFAILPVRKNKE